MLFDSERPILTVTLHVITASTPTARAKESTLGKQRQCLNSSRGKLMLMSSSLDVVLWVLFPLCCCALWACAALSSKETRTCATIPELSPWTATLPVCWGSCLRIY